MSNCRENKYLGKHSITEFYECDTNLFNNIEKVKVFFTCGTGCSTQKLYNYLIKIFSSKISYYCNKLRSGLLDINNKLKRKCLL